MSATLIWIWGLLVIVINDIQWRWFQYNSSICLPLVMGLNKLPQREFPSLAPAAWRPGSQVCGCSALRFTADCDALSVIRIRFKWRLKFGSSSHPVGAIRYLEHSRAMLTCGNPFAPPDAVPEELVERLRKLQSRVPHNSPYPRVEILCHATTRPTTLTSRCGKINSFDEKLSCERWALESRASWRLRWLLS